MDSLTTQKTKSRKIKRLAKKSRVHIILDLFFRAIEIIVVSVTVAKLCYQLVTTFEDSGVAAVILENRNLAFVVGNAIVIALIAKSGLLFNQEAGSNCKSNNLYEDFVRESSRRYDNRKAEMKNRGKQSEAENEANQGITEARAKQSEAEKETQSIAKNIALQRIFDQTGKQIVAEKKTEQSICMKKEKQSKPEKLTTKQSISVKREKHRTAEHQEISAKNKEEHNLTENMQSKSYQRSRSENLEGLEKIRCGKLKRSETDASSERFDSNDELRYKIESFIARQRRNQNDD